MGATHFTGPLVVGDLQQGDTGGPNQGFLVLEQDLDFAALAGNTDIKINLPSPSVIIDVLLDTLTAWNSATSATLTIGKTAGASEFYGPADLKATAGRQAVTLTAAQLAAWAGVTTTGAAAPVPQTLFLRIACVGATTAGFAHLTVRYAQQSS